MIYPLRRRHRYTIFVLALFVPILFVMSLLSRQTSQETNAIIPLSYDSPETGYEYSTEQAFGTHPSITFRRLEKSPAGTLAIELAALEPLRLPELLVYWAPNASTSAEKVPDDGVLLGAWAVTSSRIFELPEKIEEFSGTILLYSLSQQAVLASTPLN